jgi:hypothetical protein
MTGIDDEYDAQPAGFALAGNYPDPFNSATIIQYSLPDFASVKIEIIDILGHRLETLFQGKQAAGYHEVVWVANDYPSGVYFARLVTGSRAENIKMVLLR